MIVVLILLAVVAASAQPPTDGPRLLQQAAEAARSAKGWRVDGAEGAKVGETSAGPIIGDQTLKRFAISSGGPMEMRYLTGSYPVSYELKVCDGSNVWSRGVIGKSDVGPQLTNPFPDGIIDDTTALMSHPYCPSCGPAKQCDQPPGLPWRDLLPSLTGEVLVVGKDTALGCTRVTAHYKPIPGLEALNYYGSWALGGTLGPVSVEVCIDEPTKAVRWERINVTARSPNPEPVDWVVSLTNIGRDPEFGPDEFKIPSNVPKNPFALRDGK